MYYLLTAPLFLLFQCARILVCLWATHCLYIYEIAKDDLQNRITEKQSSISVPQTFGFADMTWSMACDFNEERLVCVRLGANLDKYEASERYQMALELEAALESEFGSARSSPYGADIVNKEFPAWSSYWRNSAVASPSVTVLCWHLS